MGISTTQRMDGAVVHITLNLTLPDLVLVDGKMTVAKKDVVNPERSWLNSGLLVLAVTLAMVVNVRVFLFCSSSFDVSC
jgi:hypothetical protein